MERYSQITVGFVKSQAVNFRLDIQRENNGDQC
jgi:hypothetical protein